MAARRRPYRKKAKSRTSFSLGSSHVEGEMLYGISEDLYNRIMQWDDSGAAEAFHTAEERRLAKERGNPLWVPKLRSDLYVEPVHWDQGETGDGDELPPSTFSLIDKLACNAVDACEDFTEMDKLGERTPMVQLSGDCGCETTGFCPLSGPASMHRVGPTLEHQPVFVDAVLEESANGVQLIVGGQLLEPSGWGEDVVAPEGTEMQMLNTYSKHDSSAFTDGVSLPSVDPACDGPVFVDAVLEESPNGIQLMVGGQPVVPSGWGEQRGLLQPTVDEPVLVEAILEEFENGQRLLVGGWPVKPSWDLADMDWAQNACEYLPHKHIDACFSNIKPWRMNSGVLGQ